MCRTNFININKLIYKMDKIFNTYEPRELDAVGFLF